MTRVNRRRAGPGRELGRRLRATWRRAPLACALASAGSLAVVALDVAAARPTAVFLAVVLALAGATALGGYLLSASPAVIAAAVGLMATSIAVATLPDSRGDAGSLCALGGLAVLLVAESAGWAASRWPGGSGLGAPGWRRALVAGPLGLGAAVAGAAVVAEHNELAGLGPGALVLGIAGVVALLALAGALGRREIRG